MKTALAILFFFLSIELSPAEDDCKPTKCDPEGPAVRFPFRLKTHQADHCGYHRNFDLSCSPNKHTILQLPSNVTVRVTAIDYKSQSIYFQDRDGCFLEQIRNLDLSRSAFQFSEAVDDFTLFSCPPKDPNRYLTCLRDSDRRVYAIESKFSLEFIPFLFCRKMYNVSSAPSEAFYQTGDLRLKWPREICGSCEAQGQYCRWKNNSTSSKEFECFGDLNPPDTDKWKRQLSTAGVIVGTFLLATLAVTLFWMRRLKVAKRENQAKINKFLQDYLALKPARYSYADIKKITSNLQDEIGQGSYGTVYKGKLSSDVYVAVKILNNSKGHEDDEFINEVGIISKIHHVNVVRLVGYCADGFRRALIYEFLQNDSLEKYVSSDENKASLGWKKMHSIVVSISRGIEYLHQGCDQRILHFDIKPHNVLLDQNLNPKISDFGLLAI